MEIYLETIKSDWDFLMPYIPYEVVAGIVILFLFILFVNIVFEIYFWPTRIANIPDFKEESIKTHRVAITLINLLLGWTVIGWIIALMWSIVDSKECVES